MSTLHNESHKKKTFFGPDIIADEFDCINDDEKEGSNNCSE